MDSHNRIKESGSGRSENRKLTALFEMAPLKSFPIIYTTPT